MNKIFLVLLMIVSSVGVTRADAADQRMNVLFLVADDLNSWMLDDADRYAGKVIAPNFRKLAGSGVNFTRAYTAAPVCSPSRTAFFSGVAPWKSGHYHNTPGANISEPLGKALSMAGAFKQAGYTTACFGKITHGWDQKEHWQKATLWEEATHVLLMFRVPGVTPAGGVSTRFVSLLDLYPTLAELCDLSSLKAILMTNSPALPNHENKLERQDTHEHFPAKPPIMTTIEHGLARLTRRFGVITDV